MPQQLDTQKCFGSRVWKRNESAKSGSMVLQRLCLARLRSSFCWREYSWHAIAMGNQLNMIEILVSRTESSDLPCARAFS